MHWSQIGFWARKCFRFVVPESTVRKSSKPSAAFESAHAVDSQPVRERWVGMNIDGCEFPDELLYDPDGLVWARTSESGDVTAGITSIYAAVAGRVTKLIAKPRGVIYPRAAAIGFLESGRHFGPIRAPVAGLLEAFNGDVLANPRKMTDSPYDRGWFARLQPSNLAGDQKELFGLPVAHEMLSKQISALRVRCFAAIPDHEMFEIGTECSAVLVKLNDTLVGIPVGDVIHLVTDDPTSHIEMVRWSDQTGQPVIDERREGPLFHFLVRKAA